MTHSNPKVHNAREKRRRERIRKNKQRRRALFFFLLLSAVGFTGIGITRVMASKDSDFNGTKRDWHLSKIQERKIPADSVISLGYNPEKDISAVAENIIVYLAQPLVKASNHIKTAEKYAFDAGEVREVIAGNKPYSGDKVVFLTFDDGPNNTITPQILDILKEKNAHATFFLVGRSISEKHREVLARELFEGHGLATHSLTHDYKKLYPGRVANPSRIIYEIEESNKLLQSIFGDDFKSNVFRYPGGRGSWKGTDKSDAELIDNEIQWIDWNCLTGDSAPKAERPTDAEGIIKHLDETLNQNKVTNMAVVLMHDAENKNLTVETLPEVIDYFRDKGYNFGILK